MAWSPHVLPLGERLEVVGVGEAMMLLQAPPPSSIKDAPQLEVNVAGAEFNACAAIARLGGRAALLTRIGDDAPGQRVLQTMADLTVDTQLAIVDPARPLRANCRTRWRIAGPDAENVVRSGQPGIGDSG